MQFFYTNHHCILDENNNQLYQNEKRTHKVTQARDVQLCLAEFLKSGKFLFYENGLPAH